MKYLIFDIETGALDRDILIKMMPEFKAPTNYTKTESISKYIEKEKNEYLSGIKAPLSALTGYIIAIGTQIIDTEKNNISDINILEGDEIYIINKIIELIKENDFCVGFNSNYFDIPFIIRRAFKLNIKFDLDIFYDRKWYLQNKFIDLLKIWQCGNPGDKVKLDYLAKFFNIGEKNGKGEDFANLYKNDRLNAIKYLQNDITLTTKLTQRLLNI